VSYYATKRAAAIGRGLPPFVFEPLAASVVVGDSADRLRISPDKILS
jgi:hypothetical protein